LKFAEKFWILAKDMTIARCLLAYCVCAASYLTAHPPLLTVGAGYFDMTSHHPRFLGQVEWKGRPSRCNFRPQVGFLATERGSFYAYAGVAWDAYLTKQLVFTPSLSPGVYMRGSGKDLQFPIEFRSCVELACVFENGGRFGVEVYHLSNAHLAHKNPGVNCCALFYSFPL
jgi:hypothetical protein